MDQCQRVEKLNIFPVTFLSQIFSILNFKKRDKSLAKYL